MLLHQLDTFIGLVVILLGVSLLIMILTQLISAFLNLRGNDLKDGLKVLLESVDPKGRLAKEAELIAEKALTHPLIAHSMSEKSGWFKRASAIRKEEFTEVLKLLKQNEQVGQAVVQIETKVNDLEEHIETWFNKTMDRVSERFKVHTRLWSVVFAVLAAFVLQLDVLDLYDKISTNAELRTELVASAQAMQQRAEEVFAEDGSSDVQTLINRADLIRADLAKTQFKLIPEHSIFSPESGYFHTPADDPGNYNPVFLRWLGTFAMSALLSLGAPFWFNVLSQLTNLRSVLAGKEKQEQEAGAST